MAQSDPRGVVLLVLLLWILWSGDVQQPPSSFPFQTEIDRINREDHFLSFLNTTRYGDFQPNAQHGKWLNLTGFQQENGYGWELLDPVKSHAFDQLKYALGQKVNDATSGVREDEKLPLVYRNVTGVIHGDWVRSDLGEAWKDYYVPNINLSTITSPGIYHFRDEFERNVTGSSGSIKIQFEENETPNRNKNATIREISALLTLREDDSFGTWWDLLLRGVHFVDSGTIILTTASQKFHSFPALPHFALTDYMFTQVRDILRDTLEDRLQKRGSASNFWVSQLDSIDEGIFAVPRCEYVVYLQQHEHKFVPTAAGQNEKSWTHELLDLVESELRVPMGAPVPTPPQLKMSMVAFSPDCGFVIESKGPPNFTSANGGHFQGPKMEVYTRSTRYIALSFAAVLAFQIVLLIRQQKDASTPSMRSRISFYSIAMLAFGDGFTFFALIYAGLLDESTFYTILGAAIFAFVSISFFGMRFLLDIWTVQATERSRQQRQAGASTSSTRNTQNSNSETSTRPILPVHADVQPVPVIIPSDQDIGAEEQSTAANPSVAANSTSELSPVQHFRLLWGRFGMITFALLILCMYAETWPGTLRALFVDALAFIYLSFWWPQIYRNVMRNCRRALRWDFVLGQSILRLLPAIYIYAVEDNILFARTDVRTLLMLLSWVWIQILVLLSQELLGARFLIPDGWAPPAYDYHPVIREDEEDATLPAGYNEAPSDATSPTAPSKAGDSKVKGKRTYDCTICGNDVEVIVIPVGGSKDGMAGNILGRRGYMVTPCRHVFHTPCLEGWMRYRLQCPNCREALPPL